MITKATQNVISPITATGSNTPRNLDDRFADVVNVKDFGAVGDGVADDREAIRNAVHRINAVGGILFFPTGNYYTPYQTHTIDSNWIEITKSDIEIIGEGSVILQNILFYIHGQYGSEQIVGASGFTSGDFSINTSVAHNLATNDYVQLLSGINSYSTDAGDWQLGSRNPTTNILSDVRFGEIHKIAKVDSSTLATLYTSVIYPNYKNNILGQSDPISGVTGATIRKLTPIQNVTIKNLVFESGANSFRNIGIRCAANVIIDNCQFNTTSGNDGRHVFATDSINLSFLNCKSIRYPEGASGSSWNSFIIGGGCQNISFDNCYFARGQQHIDVTNNKLANDIGYDNVNNITSQIISITNSLFVNCSDGFTTHPGTFNLTAVGNTFENCNTAIRVRSRRNIITGNNVRTIRTGFAFTAFYEDTLVANNNITQSLTPTDEQCIGISFNTLSTEIMNNNDFENLIIQNNTIRIIGTNEANDGIIFLRSSAPNPSFTLDTDVEKRKVSNIVVCDNRMYNCSIRVRAFTNRVSILRNMFDGVTNRTHFILCEQNSARHKIAENFFNSTSKDAISVGDTPSSVFASLAPAQTTHRVGAVLSENPTTSDLTNTGFFRRLTNRTEIHDDFLFSNGTGPIAIREAGESRLYIDSLPKDATSNAIIRMFEESSTATTGQKLLLVKGNVEITGSISKGSGSFKIEHPLSSLKKTHHLVHSFVESPKADLFYSDTVNLINGVASVNIDKAAGMTEGTFESLCRFIRVFFSNETGWSAIKGKIIENILEIECQDKTSNDIVSWLIIGERKDQHMYEASWTDENGRVIVEPIITNDQ
jgi:hypothetical protein